ncbi:hypothetical protein PBCVAP110A_645R [Paramecium bursaria Chlorella virus AP110A]|nr:hypothetical protein PBCVAP110A_645R [Paramecium bursaria Chlorella virus AP110A]
MSDNIKTLEYYFKDKSHVIFEKYTIDALGIVKNKKTGQTPSYGNGEYNVCVLSDNVGKKRNIRVARAVASTFLGKPATPEHTADHIESKQKKNDALTNIRWNCKKGQSSNQTRPETYKAAFIVVKDGVEKTVNEWVECMNAMKSPKERKFTKGMISMYAQKKQRGFAYKEYPNLEGEDWEEIEGSKTKKGHWDISSMNRVKWITNTGAENVLWGDRLRHNNCGYPVVKINGKTWMCHILAFATFHKQLWKAKKPEENVLHEDDDKEDFRPHKLRLGTQSDNVKDSHDNGKYGGAKNARMKCASYIDGMHEKNHDSQSDAAEYMKSKGYSNAYQGNIWKALTDKCNRKSAYGRTWQKIE